MYRARHAGSIYQNLQDRALFAILRDYDYRQFGHVLLPPLQNIVYFDPPDGFFPSNWLLSRNGLGYFGPEGG